MKKEDITAWFTRLLQSLHHYKYAFVLLMIGVLLMTFPTKKVQEVEEPVIPEDIQTLESRIELLLQHVDGAGEVKVLLSEKTGPVCTYQENVNVFSSGEETERKTETVLLSTAAGESAIPLQTIYPTYKGAVVLAEGADRPSVKLNLIQAVSSLTGLNSDQITVIKMKAN